MKFANIVTKTEINISSDFNVVESMDEIIHGLPTLIIGFDLTDKIFPNYDVGNIKVAENIYWTTKKTENRDKLNIELEWFKQFAYYEQIKNVNYVFVDPIQYKKNSLLKILRKIYSLPNKITYQHKDMLYIYSDNFIFGVDLKLLKYMGFDTSKLLTKIIAKSSVFLEDENIFIEYKQIIDELDNQIRFIPYLHSILNEKNTASSVIHLS
jgi:hypothetical protein